MLQKLFEDIKENGYVTVSECHIHDEQLNYGERNLIILVSEYYAECRSDLSLEKGDYLAIHSVSGGRNECVWNNYEREFKYFIDAVKYLHDIDEIVVAKSYDDLDETLINHYRCV